VAKLPPAGVACPAVTLALHNRGIIISDGAERWISRGGGSVCQGQPRFEVDLRTKHSTAPRATNLPMAAATQK
jgi:hypothetical protein